MLADQLGIRLMLWLGKSNPAPAPAGIMKAFRELTVTNDESNGDGFQITLSMNKGPDLDYDLLTGGQLESFTRVGIAVQIGTITEFLIDGVITHHQIDSSGDDNGPTLVVTGKDLSWFCWTLSQRKWHILVSLILALWRQS